MVNQTNRIEGGTTVFRSDSRLIQELGERLIANTDVAITELVKNAYDADAPYCKIWHDKKDGKDQLQILDGGHGMTLEEFMNSWMTIATGEKNKQRISRVYKRKMTGAKGVGRFAVQILGSKLILKSVADDKKRGHKTRLTATFDWTKFFSGVALENIKVPYELEKVGKNVETGTHLIISDLRREWDDSVMKEVYSEVFKITTPLQGLDSGPFSRVGEGEDPGFEIHGGEIREEGYVEKILKHSWARLLIELKGKSIKYAITFRDGALGFEYVHKLDRLTLGGLYADIRFLPKREGAYSEIPGIDNIDKRELPRWVKDNSGVVIFDHGFRMRPYGEGDDDWLHLSADKASNRRQWRSTITKSKFPRDTLEKDESLDPALFLPANHQLIGAVFLESHQTEDGTKSDKLIPAMDREGYINNKAFKQLADIIRGGIEFLGYTDKKDQLRRERLRLAEERKEFKTDIRQSIREIESSRDIPKDVKNRLIKSYKKIETQFDSRDKYHLEAREKIEQMALLGVVAGFMTHESDRILRGMSELIKKLANLASKQKDEELQNLVNESFENLKEFQGYVDYTNIFVIGIHEAEAQRFKAKAQIDGILRKFGDFASRRGIEIKNDVKPDLMTPPLLVTVYSGVLLNLYTNALKAFGERLKTGMPRKISFRAWNEPRWHIVQVMDNGVGIPSNLRDRIWDPLFSTTSTGRTALGSGMGLGLSIVKRLMDSINGKVSLVDAPSGFTTCFEVRFKEEVDNNDTRKKKNNSSL